MPEQEEILWRPVLTIEVQVIVEAQLQEVQLLEEQQLQREKQIHRLQEKISQELMNRQWTILL